YALGILDQSELKDMMTKAMNGEELKSKEIEKYSYEDLTNLKFKLLLNTDYYEKNENGIFEDMSDDEDYILNKLQDALEVKIVGIIKQKSGNSSSSIAAYGGVGYSTELTKYAIETIQESEIVKAQMADPAKDVLTGISFETENKDADMTMEDLQVYISTRPEAEQQQMQGMIQQMKSQGASDEMVLKQFKEYLKALKTDATYEGNLELFGLANIDEPSTILIYPSDFESKEKIADFIAKYNTGKSDDEILRYTDFVALMMSSITTIINAITYILVGFVAISLVVSCIMIGIITYISVLERTKEIGILRAIGASKKDISRVFNAETFIIGLCAGLLGILVTTLINIPINKIVFNAFGIETIASLPINASIILVVISMVLTVISGLIPSKMAAKKDPVEALRTE
ncbi:MAG: FtsX-like permease family protein, partial [Clostridium sp.]